MQNFMPSVNNYASKMRKNGGLFGVGSPEDDAGGTDGEERPVLDDASFTLSDLYVVDESARITVVVLQRVAQTAFLVATDGDGAVVQIDAGVDGLEGCVDGVPLLVTSDDVIAHVQRNNLLVVEHILDDDNASAGCLLGRTLAGVVAQLGILLLLGIAQLGDANADSKLLSALVALKHQRLTSSILGLVERDVVVALGASYTLHDLKLSMQISYKPKLRQIHRPCSTGSNVGKPRPRIRKIRK